MSVQVDAKCDNAALLLSAEAGEEEVQVESASSISLSRKRLVIGLVGCMALALTAVFLRSGASQMGRTAYTSPDPLLVTERGLYNITQLATSCPATCQGYDCNFWTGHGYSCADLESQHGCNCNGCGKCGTCANNCHQESCEYWQNHGYSCNVMETTYGCDCSGCNCGGGGAPAPAPAPYNPAPAPPSGGGGGGGGCQNIKPTHHYPLPVETYTRGIPQPLIAKPSGMSMCEVGRLQQDCVDKVNEFRAGAPFSDGRTRDHGRLSPLSLAEPKYSKCMNEKALSDLYFAEHKGKGCGHYSMSLNCDTDVFSGGENSCCPRNCDSYASCKRTVLGCLQQMWDEGQIVLDTGNVEWNMQTGHYWNMIGKNAKIGCGFGFDSNGKMLATQNFYS